jgi:diguanylate cyclase (GGDEF)-like protein/PAS domain S-box-containing protein
VNDEIAAAALRVREDRPQGPGDGMPSHQGGAQSTITRWQFRADQIQLLYQQVQTELLVSMLVSILVCLVFWHHAPSTLLLAWTTTLIFAVGSRSLLVSSETAKANMEEVSVWDRKYIVGSFITGLCWGALGVFPVLYGDLIHQLFVLFTLGGMTLTAYVSMQSSPATFATFMIPTLLPINVWLISRGGEIHLALSAMSILFAILMLLASRNFRGLLKKSYSMASHNTELIRKLVLARESAEESQRTMEDINRRLQSEIRERQLAEARIRASEQKLSAIFDSVQDTIYQTDINGCILWTTPSVRQLLGYSIDEIMGRRIQDLYCNPAERIEFLRILDGNYGRLQHFETRMIRKDGSQIWVSENSHYRYDQHSNINGVEGTIRDISSLKRAEEALFQEKERAQVTLGSIGDGVITTDLSGTIEYINPVAEQATGWRHGEAQGQTVMKVLRLVDEKTLEPPPDPIQHCLNEGKSIALAGHLLLIHKFRNQRLSVEVTASPIRDSRSEVIGVVLVFHDVTELRGLARQMSHQATHDALTGLINRREFEQRVNEALEHARREGSRHALCYLDLDQFKVVNDTCGHIAGDELLKQLTVKLRTELREADTLARLGGDEFGVLLEGCSVDNAVEPAEQLRRIVEDFRFAWDDKSFRVGVSIGLVPLTPESGSLSDILSAADSACYVAKDQGRNRVHVFQPDDKEMAERHGQMQWVQRIQHVLENNRFRLYFQPIARMNAGHSAGAHGEILLRILDDSGELVGPGTFIPSAERYYLMPSIDRWVVEKTFALLGLGRILSKRIHTCCINLSGQSLSDERFLDYIVSEISGTGVDAGMLCFEITETSVIANLSNASRFISTLREMGCQFALDDFGSGLSSFGYLKNLPVDYLKLDGSFVKNMVRDRIDREMVRAINQIGHGMGIETIAEFVEDEPTLLAARDIGIDYVQGFAVAEPVPVEVGLYGGPVSVPESVARTRETQANPLGAVS